MLVKSRKKFLSCILCMVFIAAMALGTIGCNGRTEKKESASGTEAGVQQPGGVLGEGGREFPFTVVDKDGNETQFEIHTDEETVGKALAGLGLIAGEEGEYGLFVKTVNGITADYDKDGVYWAFYINGEYAASGVDVTPIADGESYSFRVE